MISWEKFEELLKKGYSLDIIYILETLKQGDINLENVKVANLYQTILRKELYSESTKKLTVTGEELLSFYSSPEKEKLVKKVKKDDDFDKWWKVYPGTDSFEHKGRSFKGTRALGVKKEDCKTKIKAILNEGEYTINDLIGALEIEILQKAENSIKTGQNKMSYMQNSLTYLNQRTFEPFIEIFRKEGSKKEVKIVGTQDI